jgi:hypothetical protein
MNFFSLVESNYNTVENCPFGIFINILSSNSRFMDMSHNTNPIIANNITKNIELLSDIDEINSENNLFDGHFSWCKLAAKHLITFDKSKYKSLINFIAYVSEENEKKHMIHGPMGTGLMKNINRISIENEILYSMIDNRNLPAYALNHIMNLDRFKKEILATDFRNNEGFYSAVMSKIRPSISEINKIVDYFIQNSTYKHKNTFFDKIYYQSMGYLENLVLKILKNVKDHRFLHDFVEMLLQYERNLKFKHNNMSERVLRIILKFDRNFIVSAIAEQLPVFFSHENRCDDSMQKMIVDYVFDFTKEKCNKETNIGDGYTYHPILRYISNAHAFVYYAIEHSECINNISEYAQIKMLEISDLILEIKQKLPIQKIATSGISENYKIEKSLVYKYSKSRNMNITIPPSVLNKLNEKFNGLSKDTKEVDAIMKIMLNNMNRQLMLNNMNNW